MMTKTPCMAIRGISLALLYVGYSLAYAQVEHTPPPEAGIFVHSFEPVEWSRDSVQVEFEVLLDWGGGDLRLVPCNEWYPASVRGWRFVPERFKFTASADSVAERNEDRMRTLWEENLRDEMRTDNSYPGVYISGSGWLIGIISEGWS